MKAVKLKSGKWRVRPVDHYERDENGKRRVVLAYLVRDTKTEALQAGYAYEREHKNTVSVPLTFSAALTKYIALREPVLSPATVRSYKSVQKTAYSQIDDVPLDDLNSEILQSWISVYAADHSPKSVKNASGLVSSVLKMFRPDARFDIRLPQKKIPELYTPTDQEVRQLLDSVAGQDMERAILLAALGTLRRGEICALVLEDFTDTSVSVSKNMILTPERKWIIKAPKNPQSVRRVSLPADAVKKITAGRGPGERILNYNPETLTKYFQQARAAAGLPYFRFHDLRAYSASIRHALGIPDQYIMQAGGWKTDTVLKQVYRRTMADKSAEFDKIAADHFSGLLVPKQSVTKV